MASDADWPTRPRPCHFPSPRWRGEGAGRLIRRAATSALATSLPLAPNLSPFARANGERAERPPRRRSGLVTGAVVLAVGLAILGGVWLLRQPIFDQMAETEYARIASSTEVGVFEEFQKKHAGTNAARKAEARAADLKRQQADATSERDRQAREVSARRVMPRPPPSGRASRTLRTSRSIERFIAAHGDAPVVAEARARLAKLRADRALATKSVTAAAEWERLKTSEDEAAIERFLAAYGDTASAAQARARLNEIRQKKARITAAAAEWSRIKDTSDEALIERFIRRMPTRRRRKRRARGCRPSAAARARTCCRPPRSGHLQAQGRVPGVRRVPAHGGGAGGAVHMGSPPDEKDRAVTKGRCTR